MTQNDEFEGRSTESIIKQLLNSRCPHGYSKRKNCSRCQSAARKAQNPSDTTLPRRSVWENR